MEKPINKEKESVKQQSDIPSVDSIINYVLEKEEKKNKNNTQ